MQRYTTFLDILKKSILPISKILTGFFVEVDNIKVNLYERAKGPEQSERRKVGETCPTN